MAKRAATAGAAARLDGRVLRTKAHIEQGVANLVDIPAFEKAGMTPAEAAAEHRKDDLEAYAALTLLSQGKDLPGDDAGVPGRRGWRRFRLVGYGFALVMVAVVVAILGWRLSAGDDTESSAEVAAPAAQAPAAGPDAAPAPEGCAVDPTDLMVTSTVTLRDQGVNDPAMFVVQWNTGVTNNSADTILVTAKIASSDEGGSDAWDATTYGQVAPGETYLWPTSRVTNNAGGAAGPTTWRYVDQILAVRDGPECAELLMSPTDETAKAAIPAEVPSVPANAQLPAR